MKKLIAILTPMLLTFGSALAEVGIIGGADGPTAIVLATTNSINIADLLSKGLIVTAGGLCGVFLVLILFFLTIKMMNKMLP